MAMRNAECKAEEWDNARRPLMLVKRDGQPVQLVCAGEAYDPRDAMKCAEGMPVVNLRFVCRDADLKREWLARVDAFMRASQVEQGEKWY